MNAKLKKRKKKWAILQCYLLRFYIPSYFLLLRLEFRKNLSIIISDSIHNIKRANYAI